MKVTGRFILAAAASVVVSGAVVTGLVTLGSPAGQRVRRFDQRRLSDLTTISRAVDLYSTRTGSLPETLDDLSRTHVLFIQAKDPETAAAYEYRVTSGRGYELCAAFGQASAPQSGVQAGDFWTHGAGRQCFQLQIKDVRGR